MSHSSSSIAESGFIAMIVVGRHIMVIVAESPAPVIIAVIPERTITHIRSPSVVEIPVRIPHPVGEAYTSVESVDSRSILVVVIGRIITAHDAVLFRFGRLAYQFDHDSISLVRNGCVFIGFYLDCFLSCTGVIIILHSFA